MTAVSSIHSFTTMNRLKKGKLSLIALATVFNLLVAPLQMASSAPSDDAPTNLAVAIVGDSITLSWSPAVTSRELLRFEIVIYPSILPEGLESDPTYFTGTAGVYLTTSETSLRVEHLAPTGTWQIAVRAVYNDGTTTWLSGSFAIYAPTATLQGNFPRIYETVRAQYLPVVTGVSDAYAIVYRSGENILQAKRQSTMGGAGIDWATISACNVQFANVVAEAIYLSDSELSAANAGCDDLNTTASIFNYEDRTVGAATFEFRTEPIPEATVTFYSATSSGASRIDTFYDNETPTWPAKPSVGDRDLITGATFTGWADSTSPSVLINTGTPPIASHSYYAIWDTTNDPYTPFSVSLGSQTFTNPSSASPYYIVLPYSDTPDFDFLLANIKIQNGIQWDAAWFPLSRSLNTYTDENDAEVSDRNLRTTGSGTWDIHLDLLGFECGPDDCHNTYLLELKTHIFNPDDPSEIIGTKSFIFFVILADPTWDLEFMVGSVIEETEPQLLVDLLVAPSWRTVEKLGDPDDFPGKIFIGWCGDPAPVLSSECLASGSKFPVVEDTELHEVWINTPAPSSIEIGDRIFTAEDFEFDPWNNDVHLTAESSLSNPLIGDIYIEDSNEEFGWFDTDSDSISVWDFSSNSLEQDGESNWNFVPKCDVGPDCSEVYVVSGIPLIAGNLDQAPLTLYILVAPDTNQSFDITYDFGNDTPDVTETLPMGWHKSLDGSSETRAGYTTSGAWLTNSYRWSMWSDSYFPHVAERNYRLHWAHISVPASVTISEGDTDVATADCDDDYDCTWVLDGTADFEISEDGDISASPTLAIGTYTFAVTTYEDELPSIEITVTVVAASSDPPADDPPADDPPADDPPTSNPGSQAANPALPPALKAWVARPRLGIGETTQIELSGNPANSKPTIESINKLVCSVNSSGLVRARSAGQCLITINSLAAASTSGSLGSISVRIEVLGLGLINSVSHLIKAKHITFRVSLLARYAGKQVTLYQVFAQDSKAKFLQGKKLDSLARVTISPKGKIPKDAHYAFRVSGRTVYTLRTN
jgi:hypothetical protein